MAYFSNGTEAMQYQSKYCERCLNWVDLEDGRGYGCPIWDVHQLYNYEQCRDDRIKLIYATLIPMRKDKLHADKCNMFRPNGECQGQLRMEFTNGTIRQS